MPEEELEGLAGEILSLLQRQRVMHMDQIAAELEVSMEELTTTLTELELYGKLERLPENNSGGCVSAQENLRKHGIKPVCKAVRQALCSVSLF